MCERDDREDALNPDVKELLGVLIPCYQFADLAHIAQSPAAFNAATVTSSLGAITRNLTVISNQLINFK